MTEFTTVYQRFEGLTPDGTDLTGEVTGEVIFTPMLAYGEAYRTDDATIPGAEVSAEIKDGVLIHEGTPGVELFAGGPDSNPEQVRWVVHYKDLRVDDQRAYLRSFDFEAVPGGEVDLTSVAPIAGTPSPGVTRGEPGPPGADGPAGPPGPQGPRGERGEPGPAGQDGSVRFESLTVEQIQEITGPPGPQGEPITVSSQSVDEEGNTTIEFSDGSAVTVLRGATGPQGEQGEPGPQGETGERGEPGEIGPPGPQGERGEPGPKGEPGRGIASITDHDGNGIATITYTDFATEPLPLPAGPQGEQGPQGEPGEPGERGPAGEVPAEDLDRISALEEQALLAPKFEITQESPENPDPNIVYLVFG